MTRLSRRPWRLLLSIAAISAVVACGGESTSTCPASCELGCEAGSTTCVPACVPQCDDKSCGPDGCGGQCGLCDPESPSPICDENTGQCVDENTCIPDCEGKACGPDGCGGACPETCDDVCDPETGICGINGPCTPDCEGKSCGDDGCGGTCPDTCEGQCDPETGLCDNSNICVPNCENKDCGDDGCGGQCPDLCAEGDICMEEPGTCHSVTVPYAACQNTDDTALFVEGEDDLLATLSTCGETHSTDPDAITACLTEATALTAHCIDCWAHLMHCAFTTCAATCAGAADSTECNECMGGQCQDALTLCSMTTAEETSE